MKNNPTVSVIMPVFNGDKFLRRAVESVLAQNYTNFEFIIIDDGSIDQSAKILNSFKDKRLKVITHPKNVGIVTALNNGIQAATGVYIARMDCDDVSDPARFSMQVKFLDKHAGHAAVGSFVTVVSPRGKKLYTIEQPSRDLAIKQHLLQDSCIAHGSAMMRKSAVIDVGLYSDDESIKHAEDYDLFVRLAAKYKLANIPEYLYIRTEHNRSVSHVSALTQRSSALHISQISKKLIPKSIKPSFSIIMPTFNKAEYIGEAIESVIKQTFSNWELVIIDDNSKDTTKQVVDKYLKDPRITYLKNSINLDKARTRNRLIKESLADLIGELDSDDVLSPDALKIMVDAHKTNPKSGFIYSQFMYCDKNLVQKSVGFCREGKRGESNLHAHYASAFRTYKRKYIQQTSGFDVNLSGAEDLDMVYKIEEISPIIFVNKILYFYRAVNTSNNKANITGLVNGIKAKIYAYLRRRANKYTNISLYQLFAQVTNQFIIIVRTL